MRRALSIAALCLFVYFVLFYRSSFVLGADKKFPFFANNSSSIHGIDTVFLSKKQTPTPSPTGILIVTPSPTPTPTPTPTPMPIPRKIPHGKVIFTISGGNQGGPTVSRGSLDPYDPDYGTVQKIQIYTSSSQSGQSVQITMKTDHRSMTFPLSVATISGSSVVWEGVWTVSDSYVSMYKTTVEATGANGTTVVPIILR